MRTNPGAVLPAIDVRLAGDGTPWTLAREKAGRLALLLFYRGAFCPVCRTWLADVERLMPEFDKRAIGVIALSCDDAAPAEKAAKEWGLQKLRVGYGLDPEAARKAGLYVSQGRGENPVTGIREPRLFAEPGILAVVPETGVLYAAWIQSGPYARPHFAEVLTALDTFIAAGLPSPRGSA